MTERNDSEQLIHSFLTSQREEIADRGFSRRVMRALPQDDRSPSKLPTIALAAVVVGLFVYLGGAELMWESLKGDVTGGFYDSLTSGSPLRNLFVICALLVYVGGKKLFSLN